MGRGALFGVSAVTILVAVTALCCWKLFSSAEISLSELSYKHSLPKPPPEPAPVEEDYAGPQREPCGKLESLIHTTICNVLRAPGVFADKCIRVPGRFVTDGLEHSVIVDESCGNLGLVPWATSRETRELDEAIWLPRKGFTTERRITARFTGRFVWRPNARRNIRVLEISAVSDVKVEEVPQR